MLSPPHCMSLLARIRGAPRTDRGSGPLRPKPLMLSESFVRDDNLAKLYRLSLDSILSFETLAYKDDLVSFSVLVHPRLLWLSTTTIMTMILPRVNIMLMMLVERRRKITTTKKEMK